MQKVFDVFKAVLMNRVVLAAIGAAVGAALGEDARAAFICAVVGC